MFLHPSLTWKIMISIFLMLFPEVLISVSVKKMINFFWIFSLDPVCRYQTIILRFRYIVYHSCECLTSLCIHFFHFTNNFCGQRISLVFLVIFSCLEPIPPDAALTITWRENSKIYWDFFCWFILCWYFNQILSIARGMVRGGGLRLAHGSY